MKRTDYIEDACNRVELGNDVGEASQYMIEDEARDAVNAALAVHRPLLIWGEPGIGKSQLAKAVAKELQRVFIPFVADVHTESHDLLWSLDAVARLAEAQIQNPQNPDREAVALERFIVPGALWWALNWVNAETFVSDDNGVMRYPSPAYYPPCSPKHGAVVLIDEIDKADSSVPNGLLEALGSNRFHPKGVGSAVQGAGVAPLVLITTNDERSLPDAFVRRCLSLHLEFPTHEEAQLSFLLKRAQTNFDLDEKTILRPAAEMLIKDRAYAKANNLKPLPGVAEYFDVLRGVRNLQRHHSGVDIGELMKKLQHFAYRKHPRFPRELYKA